MRPADNDDNSSTALLEHNKKIDKQEQLNKNYEQDIAKLKAEIAQQSKTQA